MNPLAYTTYKLLAILLLADLAFLLLDLARPYSDWSPIFSSGLFRLDTDRGYAEFYQYLKFFWVSLLLALSAVRTRAMLYITWMLLFIYLLLDDMLEIHENLGIQVARQFILQPALGLRPVDFGEIAVSVYFGTIFFSLILLAWFVSAAVHRQFSNRLFGLVMALAFFGVFLDMLDIMLFGPGTSFLNTLENWGEMLVASAITWFVFSAEPARPDAVPVAAQGSRPPA